MYILVKLKNESGFFKNLKEQIGYVKYGSGITVVIEYKSELEWMNHLTDLIKHSVHQSYVNQVNNIQHIMKSENLPIIVARTDNENVRKTLEENGFVNLESVLKS